MAAEPFYAPWPFYRRKLKEPLALLTNAAEKIEKSDLNFVVSYARADEMGQLCTAFERMRAALSENNRQMWRAMEARKQLNAAFAHGLRTPLFIIRGYAEMLSQEAGVAYAPEQAANMGKAIGKNVARLQNFVDAMVRLQKLEDVTPTPLPTSPETLFSQWSQTARMLCAERGLRFFCAADGLPASMALDAGHAYPSRGKPAFQCGAFCQRNGVDARFCPRRHALCAGGKRWATL